MKHILTILLAIGLYLTSCTPHEMTPFEDDAAIYFHRNTTNRGLWQADSIKHSFFILPLDQMQDTVWIRVNAMGHTSASPRPFAITQTNVDSTNAAVSGTHFVPLDHPWIKQHMVIPANEVFADIPIILLKDPSLNYVDEVRIELSVIENEHFIPGIGLQQTFLVGTTVQAVKPALWDAPAGWGSNHLFGSTFGPVKFRFIMDVTGITDWSTIPADLSYAGYLRGLVQAALARYNLENPGNELKEHNGDRVVI